MTRHSGDISDDLASSVTSEHGEGSVSLSLIAARCLQDAVYSGDGPASLVTSEQVITGEVITNVDAVHAVYRTLFTAVMTSLVTSEQVITVHAVYRTLFTGRC